MSDDSQLEATAEKLKHVKLLAMDVDGVLTDGAIWLESDGSEAKRFSVADGLGIVLMLKAGLLVVWISGRRSVAVEKRAAELSITHLFQGARNKSRVIAQLMATYSLGSANIAYIGDDLNDLPAFATAGVRFATANAAGEVKAVADFVTDNSGGGGAIREVCNAILKAQNRWTSAVESYLSEILQSNEAESQNTAI